MGKRIGGRVLVGVALAVVAAIGTTQPGLGADPAAAYPNEPYPTVCPIAPESAPASAALPPQDPCEPPDPCAYDSDGDGLSDCEDPCPNDPANVCATPPPTPPPTTAPPTVAPPTTAPASPALTTVPPTPEPTTSVPSAPIIGCQLSCAYPRTVGLRVKGRTLRGVVTSSASGCESGATVTVWLQKKGADRRLVVLSTRSSGTFRTTSPSLPGRYYVTATSPDQPLCGSARSRAVRVTRG